MIRTKELATTYLALLLLLLLTIVVSYLKLGPINHILAFAFAIIKALLIVVVFMRYKSSLELSKVYFLLGLFAIGLLLVGILDDLLLRPF